MNLIDFKKSVTKPATGKMVEFAERIADVLGLSYPDFENFDETSEFIEDNKQDYFDMVNDELRDWREYDGSGEY